MKPKKFNNAKDQQIHDVLCTVWNALEFKGYNARNQLRDYLYTKDPCYITSYDNARKLLTELDRDDIMNHLMEYYFND